MGKGESRRSGVNWGRAPRGSWTVVGAGVVLLVAIFVLAGIVLPWLVEQMD